MRSRARWVGFILLLCLCWGSLFMSPTSHLSAFDKTTEPVLPGDAFDEAVKSFALLASFCNEADFQGIYPISRHGNSYAAAYEYLTAGFDDSMVAAILGTYTFAGPDGTLMIIPCEGIPLLTASDRAQATIIPGPDLTVIQMPLQNCYQPGDRYCYRITSRLIDQRWKITALSLTEAPIQWSEDI